jgi:putative tryptophan/tyrosine transport system substrate-binding protein
VERPLAEDHTPPHFTLETLLYVAENRGGQWYRWVLAVIFDRSSRFCLPVHVRKTPKATEFLLRREMPRCANNRLMHRNMIGLRSSSQTGRLERAIVRNDPMRVTLMEGPMAIKVARRKYIATLSGAAVAWPLVARAQQGERMRRVGALQGLAVDDPLAQTRYAAFLQGLQQLGWTDGRNVEIDVRRAAGNAADARKYAAELVALAPDVILAEGSMSLGPLLQTTRAVPIVFVIVEDPVGAGFVASLSRPGGNATGFLMFEYSLAAKWPELLEEIAPGVTRAAVIRDAALAAGIGQFAVIQSVAPSVGVVVSPVDIGDAAEIERAVAAFARSGNGGLIVTASPLSAVRRDLIITLAARYKLPAVYFERYFVADGGLISYGPNFLDQFRRAAGYVDRILKGEKPADLPVQAPNKYELIINLKTAKALGLTVPQSILARADEVIE